MRTNCVIPNTQPECHTEGHNWAAKAQRLDEALYQSSVEAEVARTLLESFEAELSRGEVRFAKLRRLKGALDAIERIAALSAAATGEAEDEDDEADE